MIAVHEEYHKRERHPWLSDTPRLWSLADMIEFSLYNFSVNLAHLRDARKGLQDWSRSRGGVAATLPERERQFVKRALEVLRASCEQIELHRTTQRISEIIQRLALVYEECSYQTIISNLDDLEHTIVADLKEHSFAYIQMARSEYFEQDALFGEEVVAALPDAVNDIKSAGNCFAADEYTATIFHLMRASEHGLRSLARKLKVRLSHSSRPQPIEFADWGKVVTACKNKVEEARRQSSGPRRQEKLELLSDASDHCLYMKEIWRNNVSHTRSSYIASDAQVAMDRVRDFLVFLATRIL